MKTETKYLIGILLGTLALLFGGVFFLTKQQSFSGIQGTAVVQIDYSKGQKTGSDSAKVKLVEFSDFECPACSVAYPFVKKLKENYPANLQIIYRHFPLSQHVHSRQAALFSEAAGKQGKFWEMHDKLFETQTEWTTLGDTTAYFLDLSKQLGLDETKMKQDIEENSLKVKIDEDTEEGRRIGVNSTPSFYLNGKKLNLKSLADLESLVVEELKK